MVASDGAEVVFTYRGFTPKTAFLVDEPLAKETMIGKAAVIRSFSGSGCFYLLGPHFEHPRYAESNKWIADILYRDCRLEIDDESFWPHGIKPASQSRKKQTLAVLKRELSNSRIVSSGMEILPIHWMIGKKVYEPEKFRVFLEAMWSRIRRLEKAEQWYAGEKTCTSLEEDAVFTRESLRRIKQTIDEKGETLDLAKQTFDCLNRFSKTFMNVFFDTLSANRNRECKTPKTEWRKTC
jgi:hypothetical protein